MAEERAEEPASDRPGTGCGARLLVAAAMAALVGIDEPAGRTGAHGRPGESAGQRAVRIMSPTSPIAVTLWSRIVSLLPSMARTRARFLPQWT